MQALSIVKLANYPIHIFFIVMALPVTYMDRFNGIEDVFLRDNPGLTIAEHILLCRRLFLECLDKENSLFLEDQLERLAD